MIFVSSCKNEQQDTAVSTTQFPDKDLNPIDRYGELLVAVQTNHVFADGKTFVDCEPKIPSEKILEKYQEQKEQPDFDLEAFVLEHF
ncbi:MAG: trehalase, partial [Bacteroidota bacterium]|nr:trehalase [Bacteroidota bacterium]